MAFFGYFLYKTKLFLQVSVDGNTTISTLRYSPTVSENNKSLKCRSENPNLPGSVIENFITLEVSCKFSK